MSDTPHRPKNWLLIKIREWHTWMGVALSAVIVVVCLTGIYLNHKDLFAFGKGDESEGMKKAGGKEKHEHKVKESCDQGERLLHTGTDLAALPVTFDQALRAARDRWGDQTIEKIELKNEKGKLVYKVKGGKEQELLIDASTGESAEKTAYGKGKEGGTDWGKLLKDMHTGKVGGLTGKLIVDLTSLVIIVLTITGIYLWAVPIVRKRRSARQRQNAVNTQVKESVGAP